MVVYSALVERMAEDGDWADGLWNIGKASPGFAIYGAKTWAGRREKSLQESCLGKCVQEDG